MAASALSGKYGLTVDIGGTYHEMEFQDFTLREFKLEPALRHGVIVLEYEDVDPASIEVSFELTSWDELRIQQAPNSLGCLAGGGWKVRGAPQQVLSQAFIELLRMSFSSGDLSLELLASSERVRIQLTNAKWEERIVVE